MKTLLSIFILCLIATCAFAQPKPLATISELLTVKAENIELRMTLLQTEAQRLQGERDALRRQACADAKLAENCIVNWSAKTATERPAPKPEKKEGK